MLAGINVSHDISTLTDTSLYCYAIFIAWITLRSTLEPLVLCIMQQYGFRKVSLWKIVTNHPIDFVFCTCFVMDHIFPWIFHCIQEFVFDALPVYGEFKKRFASYKNVNMHRFVFMGIVLLFSKHSPNIADWAIHFYTQVQVL